MTPLKVARSAAAETELGFSRPVAPNLLDVRDLRYREHTFSAQFVAWSLAKNGVDSVSGGRPFSRARQHAHSPPVLRPTELSAHSIRASSRKGSRSHSSWTSQFSRACYAGLVDVSWQHGSGFQEVSWQQDSGIQEVSWQQPVAMALCERLAMYFERSSSLTVSISSMNQTSERCPHLLSYSATHSVPAGAVAAPAEI